MTQEPRHPGFDDRDDLPSGLDADLRALYGTPDTVPTRVDDAVMGAARSHFAAMDTGDTRRGAGFSLVIRRIGLVGGPLAAAAVLAFVVWLTPWRPGQPQGPLPMPGMGRQQAQRMIEERVDDKMVGDRLDFEQSEREERFAFAESMDDADIAGEGAGAASALATLADAEPANEIDAFRRDARAASPAPAEASAPAAKSRPVMREDFDRDGVVDIRDALAMALVLQQGAWTMGPEWDLNNDGAVDSDDVSAVALAAVDLERHGEVVR